MKYQIVRTVLMCVACASSSSGAAVAQPGNKPHSAAQKEAVTVAADRFSGKSKVTLNPQLLIDTPEQCLSIEAEVNANDRYYDGLTVGDATVLLTFYYGSKAPIDYGDRELHFLVDGAPVRTPGKGETSLGIVPRNTHPAANGVQYPITRLIVGGIGLDKLEEMLRQRGRRIEMRLGKAEFTLSAELTDALRKFVAAATGTRQKLRE